MPLTDERIEELARLGHEAVEDFCGYVGDIRDTWETRDPEQKEEDRVFVRAVAAGLGAIDPDRIDWARDRINDLHREFVAKLEEWRTLMNIPVSVATLERWTKTIVEIDASLQPGDRDPLPEPT